MKKALTILLALAMVFGFVACDNSGNEPVEWEDITITEFNDDAMVGFDDHDYCATQKDVTRTYSEGKWSFNNFAYLFGSSESVTFLNDGQAVHSTYTFPANQVAKAGDEYVLTLKYENGSGTIAIGGNLQSTETVSPSGEGMETAYELDTSGTITVKMTVAADSISYTIDEGTAKVLTVPAGEGYKAGFVGWPNAGASATITELSIKKTK